jgi:hypothetical protein
MAWSPEDRRKFLRGLDATESVLLVFYKYLLYVLIVAVTLLGAYFFRAVSSDSFRDFLRIYGGILYLIFLAWAVGQLFAIRSRQSRGPSGWNMPSPGDPTIKMKFSKHPETGARGLSFQFGFGTPGLSSSTKTMRIGFSASSVAEEDKVDDAALVQADAYVTAGSSSDMVCRLLNPRYKDWSSPQQQVYRAYLENQIELRRTAASQVDGTLASTPASETHANETSPPEATSSHFPEAEASKPRQTSFTLAPIVWFFLITFVIITIAGFLVWPLFLSLTPQH